MTKHPFDLKGIDTSKVGNNKYVNYTLDDFLEDKNLNKRSKDAVLGELKLNRDYLKPVPKTTVGGKVKDFLFPNQRDYYLPTSITDRLAEADKVKTEKENFNPYSNLGDLLNYELAYKQATDSMDRTGRALDAAMEMANIRANMPFITQQMKDLSTFKQAQLLEAERAKQGMPNAIQNRLGQSALTAAAMGNMMANQTDSATRFAQVGMRNPTATFSV